MSDAPRPLPQRERACVLEDLFENAPCGYITLLPSGFIERANLTFCRMVGLSADALKAKRFSDLATVSGRVFYETHCRPLLRMQGHLYEIAFDLVGPSGGRIPVIVNATERRGEGGDVLETRMIVAKAGDRRRYERGLVDAQQATQRELEAERNTAELREQFIAVLGHDLRNPLTGVMGVAAFLEREPLSDKAAHWVRLMNRSVQRMSAMIDNILDFARGRLGGGISLEVNAVESIEPTLVNVIDELRISNPDREIVSRLSVQGCPPLDHRRIAQLVSNLVGNALTHGSKADPIVVQAVVDDTRFALSVENVGTPIAESAMENLFQPFFREGVRASQQGLGLGLYIVSEIAKAHGGSVRAQSTIDSTRFTVTIPSNRPDV